MKLRVKAICKEKGILFKDLAKRLNITDLALRKQVSGNPTLSTLEAISNALEVPLIELFEKPNNNGFNCPNCGIELEIRLKENI